MGPPGAALNFRVKVAFDKEDALWYADCLDLQGCHAFGETKGQAMDNIIDVIEDRIHAGLEHVRSLMGERKSAGWSKRSTTEVLEISA